MIAAIEAAILARLDAASVSGVLGYTLKTTESLPIELDLTRLAEYFQTYPAAGVVFERLTPISKVGGARWKVEGLFHVLVAAENLRNEKSTRLGGGPGEVGSYQMVEDAAALLIGQDLGLEISALAFAGVASLYTGDLVKGQRISLLSLGLTTSFVIEARPPATALDDFTTFSADWDIPPIGGVDADLGAPGVQLPAHSKADAADEVTLPT
jgi:phage gp37-like protein